MIIPSSFWIDEKPIGYIQYCDLYAYRTLCKTKKGLFTQEEPWYILYGFIYW